MNRKKEADVLFVCGIVDSSEWYFD